MKKGIYKKRTGRGVKRGEGEESGKRGMKTMNRERKEKKQRYREGEEEKEGKDNRKKTIKERGRLVESEGDGKT